MKNKIKKVLTGFVALFTMMILVSPVHAATQSIITTNIPGHKLMAYQIFSGDANPETVKDPETNKEETVRVLSNIEWGSGINETAFLNELISEFSGWSLTTKSSAQDVAKKISEASSADVEKVISIALKHLNKTSAIKLNNSETDGNTTSVDQGYYLIVDETEEPGKGDMLNPAILAVNGNVSVKEKKDTVRVDKTVKNEETDQDFSGSTDTSIGKEVTFKLHTQIVNQTTLDQYESYLLRFNDTASSGLTIDVIKSEGQDNGNVIFTATLSDDNNLDTENDNIDITNWFTPSKVDNTNSFSFTAQDIKAHDITNLGGKHIFITYKATLNNNAVVGSAGNNNIVDLDYSNNPDSTGEGKTTPDEAIVFTFRLDATKIDKETESTLTGAEFVVYREVSKNGETVKEYAVKDANNKITGWNELTDKQLEAAITGDNKDNYLLVSVSGGSFGIQGLGDGTYFLKETKAPAGYNIRKEPIKFEISSEQSNKTLTKVEIKVDNADKQSGDVSTGSVTTNVENTKGTTLPETGGMGTTMLYLVGGALVLGSALILITKKRMQA